MITCQKCHTPNDGDLLVCRKCKSFLGFDKIPDQKELEEEFDKLFSRKKAGQSSAPESFETREFTTQPIELPPFQTEIEADFPPDEETTVEQDALPEDPLAFDEPGLVPDSEISEAETLSEDPLEYPEEDLTLDLDESDQDDTAYEVDDDLAADWLDQIAPQEVEESTWDAPEAPAESWSEDAEPAAEVETHWEETEDDAVTAPLSQADLAPETAEDLPQRQENPLPEPEESLEHPWEEQSSPEQIEKIVEADFRRPSGPENYRDEELPEADPVAGKETLTATPEESAGERQLEKIAPTIDAEEKPRITFSRKKIWPWVSGLVLVCLVLGWGAGRELMTVLPSGFGGKPEILLKEGHQLRDKGDYEGANRIYHSVVERYPESSSAMFAEIAMDKINARKRADELDSIRTQQRVKRYLENAESAFKRGNYIMPSNDNVLTNLSMAMTLAPDNLELNRFRGKVVTHMAEKAKDALSREAFGEARDYYRVLLVMDSTQAQARKNLNLVEDILAGEKKKR